MSLPPPTPPETPNQGSQSEANTPEDRPVRKIGLGRLFTNIFRLSKATEVEVDKQAQDRVKRFIEKMNMKEQLQEQLSSQIKKLEDVIKQEKNKKTDEINRIAGTKKDEVENFADEKKDEVNQLARTKKDQVEQFADEVEKFAKEKKDEIDKLREKLSGRINGVIYLLALLGIIILPLIPRILQDFTLIRTLETQIKYLESDIEDLQ